MGSKFKFSIILSITLFIITSCGGGGGSSSSGGTNPPSGTSLGNLPNGSTVYVSSSNFDISTAGGSTTGTLSIYGGTAGYSGTITTAISSSNQINAASALPSVTISPTPCIIVTGNSAKSSCQLTISVESDVANGVYTITPTFTSITQPESITTLGTFTVTVTNNPGPPQPGSLVIQLNSESLSISESSFATITLTDSTGVSSLAVTMTSTNPNILTLAQNSCNLSTESNSCVIHYTGIKSGAANITVTASGYTDVISESIIVGPLVGSLAISLGHTPLIYGESTLAHISLNGSIGVESFTAAISLSNESLATLSESSCVLSSLNHTCSINVVASNNNPESGRIFVTAPSYTESSAYLRVIPEVNNTVSLITNQGAFSDNPYYNAPYTSVTICESSVSSCQTIDYIMVDTGSTGLRISSSALDPNLESQLIPIKYNNLPIYQCMVFGSGWQFGLSFYATVKLADEVATDLPISVIDDVDLNIVPSSCSSQAGGSFFNPANFGARGILGINPITKPSNDYTPILYTYSNGTFNQIGSPTDVPVTLSVNPISAFSRDNNGAIITFPQVPQPESEVFGTLVFGINTQSNNTVPESISIILGNPNNYNGYFKVYNGGTPGKALFDSGTNSYLFNSDAFEIDPNSGFYYCLTSPCVWDTTVGNYDGSGLQVPLHESIIDQDLNYTDNVYPGIGSSWGYSSTEVLYGFPFFLGRSVYVGFNNVESTALGASPAWGFTH